MRDIKIAAVCMKSEIGEIHLNLKRTVSFVAEATGEGADR